MKEKQIEWIWKCHKHDNTALFWHIIIFEGIQHVIIFIINERYNKHWLFKLSQLKTTFLKWDEVRGEVYYSPFVWKVFSFFVFLNALLCCVSQKK